MITVHVRKQGGAAVITIPSDMLKILNWKIGEEIALDLTQEGFIAHITNKIERKRFTVAELLADATKSDLDKLNKETRWAREGKAVGREIE